MEKAGLGRMSVMLVVLMAAGLAPAGDPEQGRALYAGAAPFA